MQTVEDFIREYCAAFVPGNGGAASAFYHQPAVFVFGDTVSVFDTHRELAATFKQMLATLSSRDFKASKPDRIAVAALTDNTYCVSAAFTRYRHDGSVLERAGGTYTVVRTDAGFRIAAVIAHAAETTLTFAP